MIFEELHESDLVSVGEVVKILEEAGLFVIALIIIFKLLHTFVDHVFSEWSGFFFSDVSEFGAVAHKLGN
jgi:hypothetical protein